MGCSICCLNSRSRLPAEEREADKTIFKILRNEYEASRCWHHTLVGFDQCGKMALGLWLESEMMWNRLKTAATAPRRALENSRDDDDDDAEQERLMDTYSLWQHAHSNYVGYLARMHCLLICLARHQIWKLVIADCGLEEEEEEKYNGDEDRNNTDNLVEYWIGAIDSDGELANQVLNQIENALDDFETHRRVRDRCLFDYNTFQNGQFYQSFLSKEARPLLRALFLQNCDMSWRDPLRLLILHRKHTGTTIEMKEEKKEEEKEEQDVEVDDMQCLEEVKAQLDWLLMSGVHIPLQGNMMNISLGGPDVPGGGSKRSCAVDVWNAPTTQVMAGIDFDACLPEAVYFYRRGGYWLKNDEDFYRAPTPTETEKSRYPLNRPSRHQLLKTETLGAGNYGHGESEPPPVSMKSGINVKLERIRFWPKWTEKAGGSIVLSGYSGERHFIFDVDALVQELTIERVGGGVLRINGLVANLMAFAQWCQSEPLQTDFFTRVTLKYGQALTKLIKTGYDFYALFEETQHYFEPITGTLQPLTTSTGVWEPIVRYDSWLFYEDWLAIYCNFHALAEDVLRRQLMFVSPESVKHKRKVSARVVRHWMSTTGECGDIEIDEVWPLIANYYAGDEEFVAQIGHTSSELVQQRVLAVLGMVARKQAAVSGNQSVIIILWNNDDNGQRRCDWCQDWLTDTANYMLFRQHLRHLKQLDLIGRSSDFSRARVVGDVPLDGSRFALHAC